MLKSILLNGVKCWLHHLPFDKGGIPAIYDQLLTDQRDIGWYHLFVAWFPKQWAVLQSHYLSIHYKTLKGQSGDKRTTSICTVITTAWLDLWKMQNKDRHGADSNHKAVILKEQADRELRILYLPGQSVTQRQNHFQTRYSITARRSFSLHSTVDQHKSTSHSEKHKNAKINATLHVRLIHTYFPFQDIYLTP
jgi:hypothetical protein